MSEKFGFQRKFIRRVEINSVNQICKAHKLCARENYTQGETILWARENYETTNIIQILEKINQDI